MPEARLLPTDRRRRWTLVAILVACLVTRSAYVVHLVQTHADAGVAADTVTYVEPARALVAHHRFDHSPTNRTPEFLRTPGYPLFLAAVDEIFGSGTMPVLLVQVLLSTLTAFLAYVLARRMWSVDSGLVAAAFVALDPLQFTSSSRLLTESLDALLLMAVALFGYLLLSRSRRRVLPAAGLGTSLAVATMVRPVTYYLPFLAAAFLVVKLVRDHASPRRALLVFAAFAAPLVVIVGGWQLRNHLRVDSWRLSGIEGKNIYQFRAAGVLARAHGTTFDAERHRLLVELGPIGRRTEGAYYGEQYRKGLHILRTHPRETAFVTAQGLWNELFSTPIPIARPSPGSALAAIDSVVATTGLVLFYVLAGYGTIGVLRARRARLAHLFVIAVVLYVLVASAGPEAFGGRGERFRTPVVPIVALYAAYGATELWAWGRSRRSELAPTTGNRPY